jgi:hypothetical protein
LLDPGDLQLIRQIANDSGNAVPCPKLCGGTINVIMDPGISVLASDPRLRNPINLTGKQLYKAVMGAGLPDELPTDANVVYGLLQSIEVKSALVEKIGSDVYLHELKLAGGITIHLAAGPRGAKVLKIVKE